MRTVPRVVAIDDDREHLFGLTRGLVRLGMACLPVHYTGGDTAIPECPHARILFADLHLRSGDMSDPRQDFAVIHGLLENGIKPTGPYLIVLWTRSRDQATALCDYLRERSGDIPPPFDVAPLDKAEHLDSSGTVLDIDKLAGAIGTVLAGQPQVAALLDWESRVSEAAGSTVASIVGLAVEAAPGGQPGHGEVARLMANLGVAAAGRGNIERDRFRALNEALLPMLADRVAALRSPDDADGGADDGVWRKAFEPTDAGQGRKSNLSADEAAKLNSVLHIATHDAGAAIERGAVIELPDQFRRTFKRTFGIASSVAARQEFQRKHGSGEFQWVLVQVQAACDYAQRRPGPLPFYLGLCLRAENVSKGSSPAALWKSPHFDFEGTRCALHVSARFPLSITEERVKQEKPKFRLREQLLAELAHHLHSYGVRPGIVSFRGA